MSLLVPCLFICSENGERANERGREREKTTLAYVCGQMLVFSSSIPFPVLDLVEGVAFHQMHVI